MGNFELPASMKLGKVYDAEDQNFSLGQLERRDVIVWPNGRAQFVEKSNHEVSRRYLLFIHTADFTGFASIGNVSELDDTTDRFSFRFGTDPTSAVFDIVEPIGNTRVRLHDEELKLAALNYSLMTEMRHLVPSLFQRFAHHKVSWSLREDKGHLGVKCDYIGKASENFGQILHEPDPNEHVGILPLRYYYDTNGVIYLLARVEKLTGGRDESSVHNYQLFPLTLNVNNEIYLPDEPIVVSAKSADPEFSILQRADMLGRIATMEIKNAKRSCIWRTKRAIPYVSSLHEGPNADIHLFEPGLHTCGDYVPGEIQGAD